MPSGPAPHDNFHFLLRRFLLRKNSCQLLLRHPCMASTSRCTMEDECSRNESRPRWSRYPSPPFLQKTEALSSHSRHHNQHSEQDGPFQTPRCRSLCLPNHHILFCSTSQRIHPPLTKSLQPGSPRQTR